MKTPGQAAWSKVDRYFGRLFAPVDDALKADVIKWSAFYEHRIRMGSKVIFHLEAFVAKFMRIVEEHLMNMDF